MLPPEPEILDARLPYADAQIALSGSAEARAGRFTCGWYGTSLHPDRGCYGIVSFSGALADLIGDRVELSFAGRSTIVYVFATADLPHDIEITRRSFASLEQLAVEELSVGIGVITG